MRQINQYLKNIYNYDIKLNNPSTRFLYFKLNKSDWVWFQFKGNEPFKLIRDTGQVKNCSF